MMGKDSYRRNSYSVLCKVLVLVTIIPSFQACDRTWSKMLFLFIEAR